MAHPRTTAGSERGFTVSELVLVLVVVIGLIAVVVISVRGIDQGSAERECRSELRSLKAASERFKAELGVYPPDDQALKDAAYLEFADTPNYRVVGDGADTVTYEAVGSRCETVRS